MTDGAVSVQVQPHRPITTGAMSLAGFRSLLTRRTGLVLACMALGVAVAIVAIERLQAEATAGRDAELQLIALRLDLAQIQDVPWGASPDEGDDPAAVRAELSGMEEQIEASLTALARDGLLPEREQIARPFEQSMAALWQILDLVSEDRGDETGEASSEAAHQTASADTALRDAARRLHGRSQATMRQARIGSATVILLLFGAFTWFYVRVARARRVAEQLAAENRRLLAVSQQEALTDALTGLGNRRALMADLDSALARAGSGQVMLALFDLDGFKQYNDNFGHLAGDALLARLGERLDSTMQGIGTAYRMGGDEFCIIAPVAGSAAEGLAALAASALSEQGEGFAVGCSFGIATLPTDTGRADVALLLADQRMYQHKASGRVAPSRQSADVLLRLLTERSTELGQHTSDVASLAERTAAQLGLASDEIERVRLAAELHDVGKAAIPDAILDKPGRLTDDEWAFIRRHTVIGERIVRAAPSLAHTAELVRWHHERHDGTGYPDQLGADEIPIGARVIAVSDAFDAMIADRPYRNGIGTTAALDELRRCAGTQFDPVVVDAFVAVVAQRADRAQSRP